MKELHGLATIPFAIVVIPMFLMWIKNMFLHLDDIKWLMIVGEYLSKVKNPVPAGKFNAGQKTWYWMATLGGIIMIVTGAQIDILRASAIIHAIFALFIVILFFIHIYMAVFAIKGAIHSIINGYKEEEEVKILHSSWYKKLKEKGKV